MCRTQAVWVLLALCEGMVSSFSWDVVVARSNRLEFYNEGELAHTATPASHRIKWITYDSVHDRVLFSEKYNRDSASSFDIANQTTRSLIKKTRNRYLKRFAYDPATELLFGTVTKSIYSFPLGPGNNNEVNGDLVITLETIPREIAVDSCGGYIYWRANNIIERALFNGSEREVIIENTSNVTVQGLTVDSQKIYWIETVEYYDGGFSIESADLDGNNRKTLYSDSESDSTPDKLTISKDFISWGDSIEKFFWQLPKNPMNDTDIKPYKIAMNTTISSCGSDIAANYKIEERTQGVPNCDALLSLLPDYHGCLNASVFCVHGTKVIGESRCDCIQGYIGERCDVSVCENYCSQGDCNVNAEGQPKCRCNAGYTGERCDTSVCGHYCSQGDCNVNAEGQPTCRCNAGYTGGRCDTSVCENYCLQGNCNVSAEGQPKCRCNAGYSGMRCDVNACHKHCLNNGVCSLNKDDEPVCQCTGQYEGERCDVLTTLKAGPNSDVDDRTPMNQTMETTTTSNTDVENHITFTITTDTPTTPQENIESITSNSSFVETISSQIPYEGFHWLPLVDWELPPNAIIGGLEDGKETYVARAYHSGSLRPGKYMKSTGIAYVPWGGYEHSKTQFEILCGFNAKWVKTNYDNIPKNSFIGGRTSESDSCKVAGKPLYVCRAKINENLVCGKADTCNNNLCYYPYNGYERATTSYEMLVED